MEIDILRAFLYIADGHTFLDAAFEFNSSQATISRGISRLELELGVPLFNRDKRSCELTNGGKYFYEDVKAILADYDRAVNRVKAWNHNDYISLTSFPNINVFRLREMLLKFEEKHLEGIIQISSYQNFDLAERALIDGKLVFVIVHIPRVRDGMNVSYLCDDPLCVVMPKDHPLARLEDVPYGALAKEVVYVGRYSYGYLAKISTASDVFPELKTFRSPFEDHIGIISGIENGHGMAVFFSSELEKLNMEKVAVRKLINITELPLCIMWRKGVELNAVQEEFRQYLVKEFRLDQIRRIKD